MPVQTLFDRFADGQAMEGFLDDFDGVTREQAEAALDLAARNLSSELPKP